MNIGAINNTSFNGQIRVNPDLVSNLNKHSIESFDTDNIISIEELGYSMSSSKTAVIYKDPVSGDASDYRLYVPYTKFLSAYNAVKDNNVTTKITRSDSNS